MSVLRDVVATLDGAGIDYAFIGATAMAVHGVSRATADVDFRLFGPDRVGFRGIETPLILGTRRASSPFSSS